MAISDLDRTDDSDVALIHRTRTGDLDAYGILHQRHVGSAKALAWRMSRSASDADDLVSEGFARVLAALQRGRGPEVAFRPYLLSTIRRLAYDRTDREKREAPVEYDLDEPVGPVGDPVVDGFERDTAAAAFASLPERWRMVLWHTEVEGQSPAEVAELLGIKPNAVAALAYRAREGLRQAYLSHHATAAPAAASECRATNDRLAAYVRGALTPTQETRVRDHLETCEDCQAAYLELGSVNSSLRGVVGLAVLGPFATPYLAELLSPSATAVGPTGAGGASNRLGRLRAAGSRGKLVALAAVVVLAVVAGAVLVGSRRDADRVSLRESASTGSAVDRRAGGRGGGGATGSADPITPVDPPSDGAEPPADPIDPPAGSTTRSAGAGQDTAVAEDEVSSGSPGPSAAPPAAPVRRGRLTPPPTTTSSAPPTVPPTTTPVVAPASALRLGLASAGPLVADRPGVLVADVGNDGEAAGQAVQVRIDLVRMTLRGLPALPTRSRRTTSGWACRADGPSSLVCSAPRLEPGEPASFYVPVDVGAGTAPAGASGRISGTGDAAGAAASPSVQLTVHPSGMAARFATIDRGDVAVIGNSLLTCPETHVACASARSRTGTLVDNHHFEMVEVDVDGDPATTNSSSASYRPPAGAEVLSAQAYWSGDLVGAAGGHDAVDPAALDHAVLRSPGGAPSVLSAERVDRIDVGRYLAVADVTDLFRAGGAGSWTLGGVQLGTGTGAYGGWTIVVAYRDASAPRRSLVVLDGLTEVAAGSSSHLEVGGFTVPGTGARAATIDVVAFEGDIGLTGDELRVGGQVIADAANPVGNPFDSTSSWFGTSDGRNLFGVDLDRFDVTAALAPGSSTVAIDLATQQDVFLTGVVAFTVDQ